METNNCPICDNEIETTAESRVNTSYVDCPKCGSYEISDAALRILKRNNIEKSELSVSYWIRHHQNDTNYTYLDDKIISELLIPFKAPHPVIQANNFIIWLGDHQKTISDGKVLEFRYLVPVIGCYNFKDVELIIHHLERSGILIVQDVSTIIQQYRISLSFDGWEKYYELQTSSKDSRLAFMAMKFSNDILAKIFNEVIKDAVSKTGFEIRRLDEEKQAGLIDDKLRVEIRRSKFLIADLSDDNNGAYWEAGYAEGLGMSVIYICEEEKFKTKLTHFDTNHHLTVQWKDDPESLKKFAEELKATIRATFPAEAKMED